MHRQSGVQLLMSVIHLLAVLSGERSRSSESLTGEPKSDRVSERSIGGQRNESVPVVSRCGPKWCSKMPTSLKGDQKVRVPLSRSPLSRICLEIRVETDHGQPRQQRTGKAKSSIGSGLGKVVARPYIKYKISGRQTWTETRFSLDRERSSAREG